MELEEFVKSTIENITNAVAKLQEQNTTSGRVNPIGIKGGDHIMIPSGSGLEGVRVVNVEFNVCLEEIEKAGNKKSIGVIFKEFGVGMDKKIENNTMSYTSVKFSIPITLPIKP